MPNQVIFNNVDMINEVTNSNEEEVAIPPRYYSFDEIIAILNTMTDITFSISTKASSYWCIWIQSPYSIHFSNTPDIREIPGLKGRMVILPTSFCESNMIDITRNRQVIQVYSSMVRSSDLKFSSQNSLLTTMIVDDPTTNYYRSVEDICIPMITRFYLLMFLFRHMDGNIMRLNGEFVLQFTLMTDLLSSLPSLTPPRPSATSNCCSCCCFSSTSLCFRSSLNAFGNFDRILLIACCLLLSSYGTYSTSESSSR